MTIQEKNGQREIMTERELRAFLGEDSKKIETLEELLLDIVNNIYSLEDFIRDVKGYDYPEDE
jgi:hypothetical protein